MKKYLVTETGITNSFGRQLKPFVDKDGYYRYTLHFNGKAKNVSLHRMIAETHIPNPFNLPMVNHKNGIKTDNRIENLEWCTGKENTDHAYKTGLAPSGENNYCSKLTNNQVLEIRAKYIPNVYSYDKLANEYNVTKRVIAKIIKRIGWKHLS